jgi:fatty acid synthase subunit alpha, fungi type
VGYISRGPALALLSAAAKGDVSIFALLGRQGNNKAYDELQSLYNIYKPYMAPLISTITNKVSKPLASAQEATSFYLYTYGLDVSAAI